jgi:hypothetical protein
VLYGDIGHFLPELTKLIDRIEPNLGMLRGVDPALAVNMIAAALEYAVLSLKHRGFEEEQEWRLLHRPFTDGGNAWVHEEVVSIRGVPQLIFKIPLGAMPGMKIPGLTLDRLLNKILIGPSLYPDTVWRAFVEKLTQRGVTNAAARVIVSDIPLRQWG